MDLADRPSLNLLQILRSTLQSLELSQEFSQDHPALQEFKRSILMLIADLQLRKEHKPTITPSDSAPRARSVLTLIVRLGRKPPQIQG